MTRYMPMPIGRVTVMLIYDDTGMLLCVKRSTFHARKLRLNKKWWAKSNLWLKNALSQAIDSSVNDYKPEWHPV